MSKRNNVWERSTQCPACGWTGVTGNLIWVVGAYGAFFRCPKCHSDAVNCPTTPVSGVTARSTGNPGGMGVTQVDSLVEVYRQEELGL